MKEIYHNSSFFPVMFVEVDHLLEGEITDNIAVEHEEGITVFREDVTGESQGSG